MRVEVHLVGLNGQDDLQAVQEQLQTIQSVRLHNASPTRLDLSYDQDSVDASDIQEAIERVGGQVITMDPVR